MKNIIIIGMILLLSACGGFNDIDAIRDAGGSSSNGGSSNNPSNPNNPDVKTNWQYSSLTSDGRIFSLSANNYSTNGFFDPKFSNIKHSPWVELEKRKSLDGLITETVTIFVDSTVQCTPSCNVRMTFNGNANTYRMRNSIDGVIKPIDAVTEQTLFTKFSTSNRAIVSLPVIGLSQPFDATYDLRDYDANKMDFDNY